MKHKKICAAVLAAVFTCMAPAAVMADSVTIDKPYISLGADLNAQEKSTVLELLGVSQADLPDYTVVSVTNQDEHDYLDSYLSSDVIGSRALSSVKVTGREEGNGIRVTTSNITYCTAEMYQNALATAGIENADVTVAGPYQISGTAGLVGAVKAYESMTGKQMSKENVDTATNELVVTSELGSALEDPAKAAELIAYVKNEVAAANLSDQELSSLIDEGCAQLGISLSEQEKQKIIDLMHKIEGLDLDVDALKNQIGSIYEKLDSLGIELNSQEVMGFLEKIWNYIKGLF